MKCNFNTEILFKYYPCTYNTLLLKVWWNQKLGTACVNQSGPWVDGSPKSMGQMGHGSRLRDP